MQNADLYDGKKKKNETYIREAADLEPYEKIPREQSSWTVMWQSADIQTTSFRRSNQVGGDATVGRLSNNVFWTFQAINKKFVKSHWTVTRERSEVRRPSADCQTTFFVRFKQLEIFLKKVTERSRDSGRWSRYRRRLSNIVFCTSQAIRRNFEKKSLNGHVTVVGGHETVGRLSNIVFWTFQAIRKFFEKSHWTVTWQWSGVTRPSADCQTTFFVRFKQLGEILKKVTERSRDSGRWSRDRRPTVKQRFLDVSSDLEIFWKKSLNGHATVVGGHATVGRLSTFLDVSSNKEKFWKKSLNGHLTVVGGHATVGRLSNNVFWTFQAIGKFFEKSHLTVTWQWSVVMLPSADCQTTFFGRFKQLGNFSKKVTERSRESGRRSRDRRPTVKQCFFDVSSN